MPIDFNRVQARRQEILARAGTQPQQQDFAQTTDPTQADDLTFLSATKDILAAPFRGIEGAIQDVYGLADTITGDILPDWEKRVLGESETLVGGFVEGTANFLTGFIPGIGIVGKVGKAARIAKATSKVGKVAQRVGRDLAAGAIADFAVFDGQENRLSNMLTGMGPEVVQDVTDFLAAREDDGEIVGRLKNTLEGAGLGVATDAVFIGLKRLWAMKKAKAAGATPEAVEAAGRKAVPDEEVEKALGRLSEDPRAKEAPLETREDLTEVKPREEKTVGEVASKPGRDSDVSIDPHKKEVPVEKTSPETTKKAMVDRLGITPKQADSLLEDAKVRSDLGLDPAVKPSALTAAERFAQGLEETDLNLSNFKGEEGAHQILRTVETMVDGVRGDQKVVTLPEQARQSRDELAQMVGAEDPEALLAQMGRDLKSREELDRRVLAYKTTLNTYAKGVNEKAKLLGTAQASSADRLEFASMLGTLGDIQRKVKGIVGQQGRGLGGNRLEVPDHIPSMSKQEVDDAIRGMGGEKKLDAMALAYSTAMDESTIAASKVAREMSKRKDGWWDMAAEYWMNSILSGPPTHVVNIASGAYASLHAPMELFLGGALLGDAAMRHQAIQEFRQLGQHFDAALKFAKQTWKSREATLDLRRRKGKFDDTVGSSAIAQRAGRIRANKGADTMASKALDAISRVVEMPGRALLTTDEFVKQVNYRSVLQASLESKGLEQGLRGAELKAYIDTGFERATRGGNALSNRARYNEALVQGRAKGLKANSTKLHEWAQERAAKLLEEDVASGLSVSREDAAAGARGLADHALDRARDVTFQQDLGKFGKALDSLVAVHPSMRFVMPFVRTPLNLASSVAQRLDAPGLASLTHKKVMASMKGNPLPRGSELGGLQTRLMKEMASSDPKIRAQALGRISMGMGAMATVLTAVNTLTVDGEDAITGSGPADPAARATLMATGWRPYSFKLPNGDYMSYARIDPIASFIGIMADASQWGAWADVGENSFGEQATWGTLTALAKNLTNKTYMKGLSEFLDAVREPDRRMEKYVQRMTASGVPSFFNSFKELSGDDAMRESGGIWESIKARVPGISSTVPPRRDLFGKPLDSNSAVGAAKSAGLTSAFLPFNYQQVDDDFVKNELASLKHGFAPPPKERNGIDLQDMTTASGRDAYDRWGELQGSIKVRGSNLKKALKRLMQSAKYQRTSPQSTPGIESPRISMVKSVIAKYRRASWEQLLEETPELERLELNRVAQKRSLSLGREERPGILGQLR